MNRQKKLPLIVPSNGVGTQNLHAQSATEKTPKALLRDARLAISQLEKIDTLAAEAMTLTNEHRGLKRFLS